MPRTANTLTPEEKREKLLAKKREYQKAYEKRTGGAAKIKYNKENMKQIAFTLNRNTEKDILDKLESVPNKNGYIKECIRRCMEMDRDS